MLGIRRFSRTAQMTLKTLGPKKAAELDQDLMSEAGSFSIDQLMELAGLSVSQAVYTVRPPSKGKNILVACGPGNNGGDGLVAARHLRHYGYHPTIYYPKPSKPDLFVRLQKQLRNLHIPFADPDPNSSSFKSAFDSSDLIIDALFGFSFKPPVREPFDKIINLLEGTSKPVLAVDIPSSWDVEAGPPKPGEVGHKFMPNYLISLTAPKPAVQHFRGERHFIGGRFLGEDVARKYGLDIPDYQGMDQIVEVDVNAIVEKL
jgi:NAD(P)H-hydrate epimerase